MNQPQTEDRELDELELLARYLVLMIQNSDYTEEEKTAWVAVLPFMKPDQIMKLTELLQGQLESKMQADFPEEFKELDAIIAKFNKRNEEIDSKLMSDLDALEAEMEKELTA